MVPDFGRVPAQNRAALIRLGPAPLYTRHVDVWDAMARLRGLVGAGTTEFSSETGRVT